MNHAACHRPTLDNLTPAMQRVALEFLLQTMDTDQRVKFIEELSCIYQLIYPDHNIVK